MVSEIEKSIIRKAIGFLSIKVEIVKDLRKQKFGALVTSIETESEEKLFSYDKNRYSRVDFLPVQNMRAVREQIVEEICKNMEANNGER